MIGEFGFAMPSLYRLYFIRALRCGTNYIEVEQGYIKKKRMLDGALLCFAEDYSGGGQIGVQ